MNDKKDVRLQQPQDDAVWEENHEKTTAKRTSRAVVLLVILLFAAVMFITYFFELKFGKKAGTVALVAVAVIISVFLYRKEIIEKLKKRK